MTKEAVVHLIWKQHFNPVLRAVPRWWCWWKCRVHPAGPDGPLCLCRRSGCRMDARPNRTPWNPFHASVCSKDKKTSPVEIPNYRCLCTALQPQKWHQKIQYNLKSCSTNAQILLCLITYNTRSTNMFYMLSEPQHTQLENESKCKQFTTGSILIMIRNFPIKVNKILNLTRHPV